MVCSMLSFQENLTVLGKGKGLLCRAKKQGDEGKGCGGDRWRWWLELGNK